MVLRLFKMTMDQNPQNQIDAKLMERVLSDRRVMVEVTRRSIMYFFYVYFGGYIKYPVAPFHRKMFEIAQDDSIKRVVVISFRNSAKSTILNTTLALWSIMGIHKKKFVVIVSQTQQRAREHLRNIRQEIEKNSLLREYLGPFEEKEDQWQSAALVIPRYEAKIVAISIDEGIRGLRERSNRPDVLIVDDVEDSLTAMTKDGRDKTFNWITSELLPTGDPNTRAIFIGNYISDESALMRLEKMIRDGEMKGACLRVPLLDDDNNIAWPGMFPSLEVVEEFRKSIGNEISWQQEYLLKYLPGVDQIIAPDDIHYYDAIPRASYYDRDKLVEVIQGMNAVGVDLAISQSDSAHYTAMVSAHVVFFNGIYKIYIKPNPIHARMIFNDTLEQAKSMAKSRDCTVTFFVENVAYQQVAVEEMERNHLCVIPMAASSDKKTRLNVVSPYIKNGVVFFPRKGCELLIQQLVYFGRETNNDLVDALVYLILGIVKSKLYIPEVFSV